jgi:hypothetical protein
MSKKITGLVLGALLLALRFPAEAQQPGKAYRMGYLAMPPRSVPEKRHSDRVCAISDTSKGRASSLSGDFPKGSSIVSPTSPPS